MTEPYDDDAMVWIRSDVLPDDTYAPSISFSGDVAVALDESSAWTYVLAVLEAAEAAAYDAAVVAQLVAIGGDKVTAVETCADVRAHRPRQRQSGTPLNLVPGVSQATGEGFLVVEINGRKVGQWSVDDARQHALAVLSTVVVARYDTAYRHVLLEAVGLDEQVASRVVGDLIKYRPESDQ